MAPQTTLISAIVSKSLGFTSMYTFHPAITVILSEALWLSADFSIGALKQPTLVPIPKVFSGTFSDGDVESDAVGGIRNRKHCCIHIILLLSRLSNWFRADNFFRF